MPILREKTLLVPHIQKNSQAKFRTIATEDSRDQPRNTQGKLRVQNEARCRGQTTDRQRVSVLARIFQRTKKWICHVDRTLRDRPSILMMKHRITGTRNQGRQLQRHLRSNELTNGRTA